MTLTSQDALGSGLVRALEDAWTAIQLEHPGVPAAVLITGAGSHGGRRGLRLGHFAASRWQAGPAGEVCEIFVGGEGLARGAGPVFAGLLHEAAHALAHERQVKDTSRQGRYHNRRFETLAEELGLHVDHDPRLGWSPTTLPDETAARYSPVVAALERALTANRHGERTARGTARGGRNLTVCVCDCGRRILDRADGA